MYSIVEMLMFAGRFVEEFDPGEDTVVVVRATSLFGRVLLTTQHGGLVGDRCKARGFETTKRMSAQDYRVEWENVCADALKRFLELFPGEGVELGTVLGWIERFKERRF